jgi:hypothetical protein
MKTLGSVLTRRDRCYLFGRRAAKLAPAEAAIAWRVLAGRVEAMGDMDVPKFNDLLISIRVATVAARRHSRPPTCNLQPSTINPA